jgi:hypothetical protein
MSDLPALIADYVAFRAARGFQPQRRVERLLTEFADWLPRDRHDSLLFSQGDALAWASTRVKIARLTTSEAEKDVAKAYYNHANSYLVKPVGFDEFKRLMDDLGFYWLSWNTHPDIKE